jgi:hypothetical protein
MVDIVEARSGCLLYQALTPGIDASYILSLLATDFHAEDDFFLISDTGLIATADLALDAGTYYAVRKGRFEVEMKRERGVAVERTEVDVGDIYDKAREGEVEEEWAGLAEQRLFSLQEQAFTLYQSFHLHSTSLQSTYSTFSHWFHLSRSLLLHISLFLSQCQARAKAILQQIALCHTPEYVESFLQQVKGAGELRSLGKWLVEAGLERRYSRVYSRTEVKLKKVLVSLEQYQVKKVEKALEELETAWNTTQSHLLPSLQAAEKLPKALIWLRTVVSAYSSLRDTIEEDDLSTLQQDTISSQITALDAELQAWKDTTSLVQSGTSLADTEIRLCKYVKAAADISAELTIRVKVQFIGKEARLKAQIGKLRDMGRYFDRENLANLTELIENERQRRREYEERVKAMWRQIEEEAKAEKELRTAFTASVGPYIPANSGIIPADSAILASIHTLVASSTTENQANEPEFRLTRTKESELEAELTALRKTLVRERAQKRFFESNLTDLAAESRLLLSPALRQSQEMLKSEVLKLADRQEAYMKDLRQQLSSL